MFSNKCCSICVHQKSNFEVYDISTDKCIIHNNRTLSLKSYLGLIVT